MMSSFQLARKLSISKNATQVTLHYFVDPKFLGERNHALGMLAALHKQYPTIASKQWLISDYDDFITTLKKNFIESGDSEDDTRIQNVIFGIGQSGAEILTKFCNEESNLMQQCYTVWSGHEVIKGLDALLGKINTVALPKHVILDKSAKELLDNVATNIIQMNGVPHNVTLDSVNKALEQWQKNTKLGITQDINYIGVIFGGDVPDPDVKQRCFTPEEASLFATMIAKLAKKTHSTVLFTNGPRTGKYDPKTKEEYKVHQENAELDKTSAAFLQVLLKEKVDYQLYDFIPGNLSAYQPILATIAGNDNSIAFVTADSISYLCEMLSILPQSKIKLVQVGSMRESHISHMELVLQNTSIEGYAIDVNQHKMTEISSKKEAEASTRAAGGAGATSKISSTDKSTDKPKDYKTAAETLASGIMEGLQSLNIKRPKISRKSS